MFLRLSAFTIAVLGTVFLVPTSWITLGYTLLGVAATGANFVEGKIGIGLLRLGGTTLLGATEIFALYLCYGFFRYAFQDSQAWRGRFLWASTCSLSGLTALVIAILIAVSRYSYGFWDSYGFWEAGESLCFAIFTGACWLRCNRA